MAFKAYKVEVGEDLSKRKTSPSLDLRYKDILLSKDEAMFIVQKFRDTEFKGLEFQKYYQIMVKLEKILNS